MSFASILWAPYFTCELGTNLLLQAPRTVSWIFPTSLVFPYWLCRPIFFLLWYLSMFFNLFIQDSSTQMEHLFFSKVLLLLPNFPDGLTEAQRSQVTCPGQTASVARNRLEPAILLAPYPALDHVPFYKLFCTRDKLCPLFLLVYRYYSNTHTPLPSLYGCSTSEYRLKLFGGH